MRTTTILKAVWLLVVFFISTTLLNAQNKPGRADSLFYGGMGVDTKVNDGLVLPDSTIMIAGAFEFVHERLIKRIARIKQDGSNDYTFDPGTGADDQVNVMARQADGKIIIGGDYTHYNGTARNRIARINVNGSLDTGFDPGSGFNNSVYDIYLQTDSMVVVVGGFTTFNGVSNKSIVRLKSNGAVDTSFHSGTGASNDIYAIDMQPNGKYIIAGTFTSYNGTSITRIARLNHDGTLDNSFSPGSGANNIICDALVLSNGKIIAGGYFTTFNGTTVNRIVRLTSTGSIDTSFHSGTGFTGSPVNALRIQSDGKILVTGSFSAYNGTTIGKNVIRIDTTGARDTGFDPGSGGLNYSCNSVFLNYDGKIFVGGTLFTSDIYSRIGLVKLSSSGTVDHSFMYSSGLNDVVNTVGVQSDGKVIIGGEFTRFDSTSKKYIIRVNKDGTIDTSFHAGTGPNNNVTSLVVLSNDKILVGGSFTSFDGTGRNRIAKLNSDGSLDGSYNPAPNANVNKIVIGTNGKIYVLGSFTTFNSVSRTRIARLASDGTLESTTYGSGFNSTVNDIAVQSDGKIIAGGNFTSFNGTSINRIARIDTVGNIDNSFSVGTGFNAEVEALALQSDGKVIVGGTFSTANGAARNYLARLKSTGSLDSSYNSANNLFASTSGNHINSIELINGGALVGGQFGTAASAYSGLVYLDTTGVRDTTNFYSGKGITGTNGAKVNDITLDAAHGRILTGGLFTKSQGQLSNNVTCIIGSFNSTAVDSVSAGTPLCANGTSKVYFKNIKEFNRGNSMTVQLSDSGGSFSSPVSIGSKTSTAVGWDSVSITIPGTTLSSTHYKVRIIAKNPIYTSAVSDYFSIAPLAKPTITAGSATTFCSGGTVTLTSSVAEGYLWSTSATTQGVTASSNGNYLVTATIHNCSTRSDTTAVTVNSLPSNPGNPTSNSPQCDYTGVTLTRSGTVPSGETWYWQTGSTGTSITDSGSTYNVMTSSTFYIRSRNNTTLCWSSGAGSATVAVNAAPSVPTSVTPSSANAICNGANLNLNATSSGNTIYWFTVSSGGSPIGNSASAANYSVSPTSSVTYYAQAQTGAGCVSTSRTATGMITVNSNPTASITPSDTLVHAWDKVVFTAHGGATYFWKELQSSSQTVSIIGMKDTSIYNVKVTDSNGCIDSTHVAVFAQPSFSQQVVVLINDSGRVLTACKTDTFQMLVDNNTANSLSFVINFQTTDTLIANNFHLIGSPSGVTQSIVGKKVSYRFDTLSANRIDTIRYSIYIPCELIPTVGIADSTLSIKKSVTDTLGGGMSYIFTPNDSVYLFRFPNLSLLSSGIRDFSLAVGQDSTFSLNYTNAESGDFDGDMLLYITNGGLSLPGFSCDSTILSIDTLKITIGNSSPLVFPNPHFPMLFDALINPLVIPRDSNMNIKLNVRLNDCIPSSLCSARFGLDWGCHGDRCNSIISGSSQLRVFPLDTLPYVVISRIFPKPIHDNTNQFAWDSSCVNQETEWEYLIVNRGLAKAENVFIRLYSTTPTYTFVRKASLTVDTADSRFPNTNPVHVNIAPVLLLNDTDFATTTNCFDQLKNISGNEPIKNFEFTIPVLQANQKVVLKFKTWRCCADDNEYNTGVDFNHWQISSTYVHCDANYAANTNLPDSNWINATYTAPGSIVTPTYRAFNIPNGYISSNAFEGGSDIELVQEFQQSATDIMGPHGTGCSGSYPFTITNKKFTSATSADFDTQLFCDMDTTGGIAGITGAHARGQFKIEFKCDSGVSLDPNHSPYIHNQTYDWYPTYFVTGTRYSYFVFDLDQNFYGNGQPISPLNNTSYQFRNFFINSQINFSLQGCCPLDTPTPSVTVNTLFNPQIRGHNCDTCFIPLAQRKFSVALHCPGCITPGVITYKYDLHRTNFGFADVNDDGLPDNNALTPVTYAFDTTARVNILGSIIGDTLEGIAEAYLYDGDASRAFTLEQWQAHWDSSSVFNKLSHFYLEQTIDNADLVGLKCIGAQLYYKSSSGGSWLNYTLPGISSSSPLQPDSQNRLLFHVTVDSLPGTVNVQGDDSFRVVAKYFICENPQTTAALLVSNYMYLTVPTVSGFPYDGGTILVGDEYEKNDSIYRITHPGTTMGSAGYNPATSALFLCEAHGGVHYVYPIHTNYTETWHNSPPSCDKSATIEAEYFIDAGFQNVFRYEYRMMSGIITDSAYLGPVLQNYLPVTFHFTLPQGYMAYADSSYTTVYSYLNHLQSEKVVSGVKQQQIDTTIALAGSFSFNYHIRRDSVNYSPFFFYSGMQFLNPSSNYGQTFRDSSGKKVLLMGDEMFQQAMRWSIVPMCDSAHRLRDTIHANDAYCVIPEFEPACSSHPINRWVDNLDSFILTIPHPVIHAIPLNPTFKGPVVDCPIKMYVDSGDFDNLVYYIEVDANSLPDGIVVTCLSDSAFCTGQPIAHTTIDSFYRYPLGTLDTSKQTFHLQFGFTRCDKPLDTTFHIPVYYYWSCDGLPDKLPARENLCAKPDTVVLDLDMLQVLLTTTQLIQPDTPYTTCKEIEYRVALKNTQQGGVGNITTVIELPPHVRFTDAFVGFTGNHHLQVSSDTIAGSVDSLWTVDMTTETAFSDSSSSVVGADGLNNGEQPNGLRLRFILTADCHTDSIPAIAIKFNGDLYCGSTFDEAVADSIFQHDVEVSFNPIPLTNGCGPYIQNLASASCSGAITYTVVGQSNSTVPPININWSNSFFDTSQNNASHNYTIANVSGGTYTATATDANGCKEDSVVIVTSTLHPVIKVICSSPEMVLYVDSLPSPFTGSYVWSTGSHLDTIHINAGDSINYSVTVTDTITSCPAIASKIITTFAPGGYKTFSDCNNILVTSFYYHDGSGAIVGANPGTPPYTFIWQDSLGSTQYDIPVVSTSDPHLYTSQIPYSFLHQDLYLKITDDNGCFAIGTHKFDSTACCVSNPDTLIMTIKQDTATSQISIPIGTSVYVADSTTLTVDNAFVLQNCELVLGSNSKIIVQDSASLYLKSSYVHGCQEMWDGIYGEIGAIIKTDSSGGNRTKIEDALNGITIYGNGTTKLLAENTDFSRNRAGINMWFYSPHDSLSFNVSGCNFGMGTYTTMLQAPSGYANHLRPLSGIGMLFSGLDISIPNPSFSNNKPNTFSNMNNGIAVSYCGHINVNDNYFTNIRNYDTLSYNGAGAAVWAGSFNTVGWIVDQTLKVQTSNSVPASNSTVHFKRCDYGVFSDWLKVNITRTRMDSVTYCVKTMNSRNKVAISDNYFTNTNYGITMNNHAATFTRVWNNTIYVNPPTSQFVSGSFGGGLFLNTYGIDETEVYNTVVVTSTIDSNHIYGGRNCIALNNTKGTQVYDNLLFQTDTFTIDGRQAGIYAANCNAILIQRDTAIGNGSSYCDTVNGVSCSGSSAYRKSGFSFYGSTGELCTNRADSIGYGMYFASECIGMNVRKNSYGKSKFGIVLRSSGSSPVLGNQGYDTIASNIAEKHENEFTGIGTSHTFDNNNNYRTFSFVDTCDTCPSYIPPKFYYTGSADSTNIQYADSGGALLNGIYYPSYRIQPVLIHSSNINSFQCSIITTPSIQPWSLLVAQGSGGSYMQNGYADVGKWLAERRLYNTLAEDTTLIGSDTTLQNFYTAKTSSALGEMNLYEQNLKELQDSTIYSDSSAYHQALNDADVLCKLISHSNTPENNYVTVSGIYLSKMNSPKDTFTTSQLNYLIQLASQCPYVGGDAVYGARTLLAQTGSNLFYDDIELCSNTCSGKRENETTTTWQQAGNAKEDTLPFQKEFVKVFPNPANNKLNLLFEAKVMGKVKFELLNLMGQTLKVISLQDGSNYATFEVNNLPAGMYMWRLKDKSRTIGSGTVVIQR